MLSLDVALCTKSGFGFLKYVYCVCGCTVSFLAVYQTKSSTVKCRYGIFSFGISFKSKKVGSVLKGGSGSSADLH